MFIRKAKDLPTDTVWTRWQFSIQNRQKNDVFNLGTFFIKENTGVSSLPEKTAHLLRLKLKTTNPGIAQLQDLYRQSWLMLIVPEAEVHLN